MPSSTDFLPSREADLVPWTNNFDAKITLAPTSYGLTAAQATAYAALNSAFVLAWSECQENDKRTPSAIVTKDDAKEALIDGPGGIRELARIVQAFPGTSNTERSDLGLTIRDEEPSPIPQPTVAPVLTIVSVTGRIVKVKLKDAENLERRGQPTGVQGATILTYIGTDAPADPAAWSFHSNTSKTAIDVELPGDGPPGARRCGSPRCGSTRASSRARPRRRRPPTSQAASRWRRKPPSDLPCVSVKRRGRGGSRVPALKSTHPGVRAPDPAHVQSGSSHEKPRHNHQKQCRPQTTTR